MIEQAITVKSLVVLACLAFGCPLSSAMPDPVVAWNTLMLDAIRNESTAPPLASRNLAILHAAVHDALNAIRPTYEIYFVSLTASPTASLEAAAVGAAYECLAELYPSQMASFDAALNRFLANTEDTPSRDEGLAVGQMTAVLFWCGAIRMGRARRFPTFPAASPAHGVEPRHFS